MQLYYWKMLLVVAAVAAADDAPRGIPWVPLLLEVALVPEPEPAAFVPVEFVAFSAVAVALVVVEPRAVAAIVVTGAPRSKDSERKIPLEAPPREGEFHFVVVAVVVAADAAVAVAVAFAVAAIVAAVAETVVERCAEKPRARDFQRRCGESQRRTKGALVAAAALAESAAAAVAVAAVNTTPHSQHW